MWSVGLASAGLVLLRPHALLIGLPLTLVAWLMQDRISWVVRFAPSLAWAWCCALLGFAALWRFVTREPRPRQARVALVAFALVAPASAVLAVPAQPGSFDVYTFSPRSPYSPALRAQADELFARYRREAAPDEPTAASPFLFRYVHDRDLYWLEMLEGWPRPRWILADHTFKSYETYGLDPLDYEVVETRGPFSLRRARSHPATAAPR
jgi:hypothetical protein